MHRKYISTLTIMVVLGTALKLKQIIIKLDYFFLIFLKKAIKGWKAIVL